MTTETREDSGWAWAIKWATSGIVARAEVRIAGIYGDGDIEADDDAPPDFTVDVRSDGCMEIDMDQRYHFCSAAETEAYGRLISWLHKRGVELAIESEEGKR